MPNKGLILVVNFNQAVEIRRYLQDCLKHFRPDQILVVDDGSTDGSDQLAEELGLRVLRHGRNQGIGAAIRTGLLEGKRLGHDWVLISSSNGKMVPSEFAQVSAPVDQGEVDFTQGSRYLRPDSSQGLTWFRQLAIPVFSLMVSLLLRRRLSDATCGLRCYRLRLLNDPRINMHQAWLDRYELEYYLLYKFVREMKVKWIEVPVTIRYSHLQKGRRSKIVPFSGWWSMLRPFVFLALGMRR